MNNNTPVPPELQEAMNARAVAPLRPAPAASPSPAAPPVSAPPARMPTGGAPQLAGPSAATYLSGALSGASQASNPIGAILGAVGGAMGAGNAVDQRNQTYQALVANGMSPQQAQLAVQNPKAFQLVQAMQPKQTDDIKEYQFDVQQRLKAGVPPNQIPRFGDWMIERKKAGATAITVNSGDKAWDKSMAELGVKQLENFQKQSLSAREQIATLDTIQAGLDAFNKGAKFGTGALGDFEVASRRFLQAYGVGNAETLQGAELARATANKLALLVRSPDSGMGMPGALSDNDLKFLKATTPGLDKTPAGNTEMIRRAKMLAERKLEVAQLAEQYAIQNRSMVGFERFLDKWAKDNPLFPEAGNALPTVAGLSGLRQQPAGASGRSRIIGVE